MIRLANYLQECYNPESPTNQYLSILFGQRDVNILPLVTVSLDGVRQRRID